MGPSSQVKKHMLCSAGAPLARISEVVTRVGTTLTPIFLSMSAIWIAIGSWCQKASA